MQHYDLGLAYDPATGRLDGRAVITFTATTDLDSFSLDLRDLRATSVVVDNAKAKSRQVPAVHGVGASWSSHRPAAANRQRAHRHRRLRRGARSAGGPDRCARTASSASVTAPSSPTSPKAPPPGTRSTTSRPTRPPTTSRSPCRRPHRGGQRRAGRPAGTADGRTTFVWHAETRWPATCRRRPSATTTSSTQTGPRGLPILNYVDAGPWRGRPRRRARPAAADDRLLRGDLRPVPVQLLRRDRRRRHRRRVRAGDPDPAHLRRVRRTRSPSRTSWPTSGSGTASPRSSGRTSGSTRASPPTPSGCGASRST